jgi:hypothetical protein
MDGLELEFVGGHSQEISRHMVSIDDSEIHRQFKCKKCGKMKNSAVKAGG